MFFFFKQKTAYEMRISDWSSDVCSSDLANAPDGVTRMGWGSAFVPVTRAIAVAEGYADGKATMVNRRLERGKLAYIVRVQNPYAHIDAVVDAATGTLLDSKTVARELTSEGLSI